MSLDISYSSFNPRRADERWKNFPKDVEALKAIKNTHDQLFELQVIDANYASIYSESFDDNDVASFIIEDFLPSFLKLPSGEVSGDDLVKLFSNLTKETLGKLIGYFSEEYGGDDEDKDGALLYITDFLKAMKPVVQDLKNNPDSVLVLMTAGYDEFSPKSSARILEERAHKHAEVYKEILSR